ncbi:exodeoxyribonuclease V subunit gamma [secondary endosymbiont of Ctenarytaina eucalypti]|uniref:RecBCD enzyme subunit RecC n=1 Tax=secondary endosymbiont of Ctenarytaina eucalypti TaxID=1199245 RepID=J3Z456_9ENTR|nr:exodeoxyribonuclease V subunit gamma [secondary endosymbiont of Ctenarytaina eucalypti]AFP85064.1 DNA helicase/exodeoxyribonuclease V, gamma subunit [secondary endosymbiont of Ctenarytaina eucalypti]
MFTVYHSNQIDVLQALTARLIAGKRLHDPFQPEVILVQSNGMAQWMHIELAEHFGIAANIEFLVPARFIWKMLHCVLPDIPKANVFSKPEITWKLLSLLPRLCKRPDFIEIHQYIRDDHDQRKSFHFSNRVADLFDQYLLYRPDWLEAWRNEKVIDGVGDAQRWQAPLWRALIAVTEKDELSLWLRTNLYKRFIQTLAQIQTRPPGLPERVFIFGISALPPIYLQMIKALSRYIDMHLLYANPCRYYWGDLCDRSFLPQILHCHRRQHQAKKEQMMSRCPDASKAIKLGEIGNPLLTSWGKQGRDYLYLLAQISGITEVNAFVTPSGNNLLSLLQHDILELEDHTVLGMHNQSLTQHGCKRLLRLDDRSLSLHVCHSPQREVEVLYDRLLAMIEEDPTLLPREIIVMVAQIDHYTPAIQAVFGNADSEHCLPFTISDTLRQHIHPVVLAFLSLLDLPKSRFTPDLVLGLLEVPALATCFSINEQGLQLLRLWVVQSGIRWGLDDDTPRGLNLPATGQHTWQFGLTRMLLGYAMDSDGGDFRGVLPYDESSGLTAILVGQLGELLMRLRQWRDHLAQSRSLDAWLSCAHEMITDFFSPDPEEAVALTMLENQWQQLLQCGSRVRYNEPVPISLLQDELVKRLNQKQQKSQQFLAGAINFCTLTPMRCIPFRVVCLLGMNDGVYPRTLPSVSFDLMEGQTRRGDPSPREDDRYLFLQALLSAKQRLYVSFVGRAIQDNTPRYPSILVRELIDYIAKSFHLPGDEHADSGSSTDRVCAHLWHWHNRMPFAAENFLPGSEYQSFAKEWLPAAGSSGKKPQPDFVVPLTSSPRTALALDALVSFYRHPVRAWFMQRMAISFHHTSLILKASEPFIIDGLTRYQLNEQLLNSLIDGHSPDKLFRQVRAAGLLPYGAFGELYWDRQSREMSGLAEQVRKFYLSETDSLEVSLMLDDVILSGWLPRVQANGLLRWRPGVLSGRDGMMLWVEHLAYCAMGGAGESRMIGRRGQWHFVALPPSNAKACLLSLVAGYYQGMTSPLLLLHRAGSAWITHCYNKETQGIDFDARRQCQARDKIIQAWQGKGHLPGEGEDLYLKRLMHTLEEKRIQEIIEAAERYLLPPFMFNLAKSSLY